MKKILCALFFSAIIYNLYFFFKENKKGKIYLSNLVEKKCLKGKQQITKYIRDLEKKVYKNNLAAVFDIDDTCLLSYAHEKKIGNKYGFRSSLSGRLRLDPVYDLYRFCLGVNIKVFFITAREMNRENEKYTREELKSLMFYRATDLNALFMRPPHDHPREFKYNCRKKLQDKGYVIILNIGDSNWDFYKSRAIINIKLPNLNLNFKSI